MSEIEMLFQALSHDTPSLFWLAPYLKKCSAEWNNTKAEKKEVSCVFVSSYSFKIVRLRPSLPSNVVVPTQASTTFQNLPTLHKKARKLDP
jgi:hypothetical protein